MSKRHVILTGSSGVGKTTLVRGTVDSLRAEGVPMYGFYTEEVRSGQRQERVGFDVVTLDGSRSPLARVQEDVRGSSTAKNRVGKYAVDVESFDSVSWKALDVETASKALIVIDEVGKMELFSRRFPDAVRRVFSMPCCVVLATVPRPARSPPAPLVQELTSRPDTSLVIVTRENRDRLHEKLVSTIKTALARLSVE